MALIQSKQFTIKVSSVLGKDVKAYGKQYLFDDCADTCWNSDQGTPQWIVIGFLEPSVVTKFTIQFQGGFAAQSIVLQANGEEVETFHPLDANQEQSFILTEPLLTGQLKFLFPQSTDTFGRIVVYKLNLYQEG